MWGKKKNQLELSAKEQSSATVTSGLVTSQVVQSAQILYDEYKTIQLPRTCSQQVVDTANTINQVFPALIQKLHTVEYTVLTKYQAEDIRKNLNDYIPACIKELETCIIIRETQFVHSNIVSLNDALTEFFCTVNNDLPSTLSTLYESEPKEEKLDDTIFPDTSRYSTVPEIAQKISQLHTDWDQAKQFDLNIEDEYIIQEIASSYLPEALKLYDKFRARSKEEHHPKAVTLLTEQLELLHKQVLFVIDQNQEDDLSMMEIHTSFLKEKNKQLGIV